MDPKKTYFVSQIVIKEITIYFLYNITILCILFVLKYVEIYDMQDGKKKNM